MLLLLAELRARFIARLLTEGPAVAIVTPPACFLRVFFTLPLPGLCRGVMACSAVGRLAKVAPADLPGLLPEMRALRAQGSTQMTLPLLFQHIFFLAVQ